MKIIHLLSIACIIAWLPGKLFAQEIEWAVAAQGVNEDQGTAVTAGSNGNIYHAGEFGGEALFGEGERGETLAQGANYVARHESDGTLVWVATIASDGGPLSIEGISVDPAGNVYIAGDLSTGNNHTFGPGEATQTTINTGGNSEDMFVAKFDARGGFEWVRQGGTSEVNGARDIVVDNLGASYVTGFYRSNMELGADGSGAVVVLSSEGGELDNDLFIAKYDRKGDLVWAKSAGGAAGADLGAGIGLDAKRNVYLTGQYLDEAVFGKEVPGLSETLISGGGLDGFVVSYTRHGNLRWAVSIGGTGIDLGVGLASRLGKSVVVGRFADTATFGSTDGLTQQRIAQGTDNVFVARYDEDGKLLWSTDLFMDDLPGSDLDVGYGKFSQSCVMSNFDGNATFGFGTADETTLFTIDPDMFFACYSGAGAFQWVDDDPSTLNAGTMTQLGEIVVTGGFENVSAFGSGDPNQTLLVSEGMQDIFLAKYISENELGLTLAAAKSDAVRIQSDPVPEHVTLESNYPNPFNPQTSIRFSLPESAVVSLVVYDLIGRIVKELVNGELGAGMHEVTFAAGDLPGGLYLYKLTTPAGVESRTMTLLK